MMMSQASRAKRKKAETASRRADERKARSNGTGRGFDEGKHPRDRETGKFTLGGKAPRQYVDDLIKESVFEVHYTSEFMEWLNDTIQDKDTTDKERKWFEKALESAILRKDYGSEGHTNTIKVGGRKHTIHHLRQLNKTLHQWRIYFELYGSGFWLLFGGDHDSNAPCYNKAAHLADDHNL